MSTSSVDTSTSDETNFIEDVDVPPLECSIFEQDCPRGQKCTLGTTIPPGRFDTWQCVPVVDRPAAVGETCTYDGDPSRGLDDCEHGSVCWGFDPRTMEGTCVAFCTGDSNSPECADPGSTCWTPANGIFALCFVRCDPLAPDCPPDRGCYPLQDVFVCGYDNSGDMGAPGDDCVNDSLCDSGHICAPIPWVPGCADNCCTALCDLDDPMPACLPGQDCVPWSGDPDPEYTHVGVCRAP